MSCQFCGSSHVRKSRSGNRWIPFPLNFFVIITRCYGCARKTVVRSRLLGGPKVAKCSHEKQARAA
jgi:hypothetical protein